MKIAYNSTSKRKGITPIIATVLLLGITVAIGLTVYTQAQGMIGNTDTSDIDRVRDTELALVPVYNEGGEMQLQISNKGDRAINTSDFTIYYGPPNWGPQTWDTIDNQASDWTLNSGNQCFTGGGELLSQGERVSCATGIKFPGALESVDIRVEADDFEYSESTTCRVESEGAKSCS